MALKKSSLVKFSIIIIPVIFYLAGSNLEKQKFGNDPNYVYLMNAVGLCTGNGVGYIDHPGTTVIQISALTIIIKHAVYNPNHESLMQHFLKDPHAFSLAIQYVFLIMNTLILLLLGWVALKKTKLIWVALFFQASVFITINLLDHIWAKISPAPILFFITNLFIILTLYFYTDPNKSRWRYVIFYALVIGAGIVTKATFVPLAFLPFIIIPTIKRKLFYALAIIPSFVLFSIPIIPEYETMYYWFKRLGSHSGIYGHGESGFIDWHIFFPNILKILVNNPIFAILFLAGLTIIILSFFRYFKYKKKPNDDITILFGLVVSCGTGILLVAKHYQSNHYLIPELLLTGIMFYFIFKILFSDYSKETLTKYIGPSITIILIAFLIIKQPAKIKYINDGYKKTNIESDTFFTMLDRDFSEYTKIVYYPVSINLYSALNFGNVYSKQKMLPNLKKLYGDVYFLNTTTGTFQNWTTDISIEDIIQKNGKKVILVSGPRNEAEAKDLDEIGFPVQTIYKGRIQSIYILDTIKYAYLQSLKADDMASKVICDMESTNSNGSILLGSNNEEFGNAKVRTNEVARSGIYSVKMDENTKYATEYILKNLKEGDNYEVEVWRKSKENSGKLVVSSNDAKLFYKTQTNVSKTDENGWEQLKIEFTITPQLLHESLKIYLMNNDEKLVYFDDLSIKLSRSNSQ